MKKTATLLIFILMLTVLLGALSVLSACGEDYLVPHGEVVKYSEFGAKGDGKTDDFEAIYKAHQFANKKGLPVSADKGATYYIGCDENSHNSHEKSAVISTDTYWLDAKFIIDDKDIPTNKIKNADIFTVESQKETQKVELPEGYSLKAGQRNIGIKFDEAKLVHIVNKNKKDFIRSGVDQNSGTDRQEVILVDKNGNVDKSTPITWDYYEVTSMTAYPVNETKLTVSGGYFTTIEKIPYMSYVNRGLLVKRSNVLVKGVKHNVVDESQDGSSYSGFYRVQKATNVTFEKCVMWGRCTPIRSNGLTQGTYDINANLANNITWKNCTQANDLRDCWGVMGSNHSRNLNMIGCRLSRFDAHQGVYNATIKDSELYTISVTGFGTLRIENVIKNSEKDADYGETEFLGLRADYGAFWRGDIIMKDCTVTTNATITYLIKINHKYDWDYGYQCHMPTNVKVENVNVVYTGSKEKTYFYVFSNLDLTRTLTPEIWQSLANPLVLTKKVTVTNCKTQYQLTHNQTGLLDGKTQFIQR